MNITLEFYGRLRTQFSEHSLAYQTDHNTVDKVFKQLCKAYDIAHKQSDIRPIINDEFAQWQDPIKAGDVLGFLPPASGG